ncbi:C-C chemokine receptor type 1-like [Aplochiton taeniatus]
MDEKFKEKDKKLEDVRKNKETKEEMEDRTFQPEETTIDYDYSGLPIELCSRHDDNTFGARMSLFYYLIFVVSLLGNGLVLLIIYKFEKLSTVTNIFLLNLVVSDLVFTSSLPFWAVYQQLSRWVFGRVMCKVVGSAYFLGIYSSVLFLALMTFDRHVAVVYAVAAPRLRRRSYAVISCAAVWLLSLLACVKPLVFFNQFDHALQGRMCDELPDDSLAAAIDVRLLSGFARYLQLCLFCLFPLAVIVYCYARIGYTVLTSRMVTKFKTVRLIFVIVLLFFSCWTPYNVVVMVQAGADESASCSEKTRLGYALHATRNLAYLYFCVGPLFYTFVGQKFQNHFRRLLVERMPCLQEHISVSQSSRTNVSLRHGL